VSETPDPKAPAPAADPAPALEERIARLEKAIRTIAISLYGPNGGGAENVADAEALFAELMGD